MCHHSNNCTKLWSNGSYDGIKDNDDDKTAVYLIFRENMHDYYLDDQKINIVIIM